MDVLDVVQVGAVQAKRCAQEIQVSRGIVEKTGKSAGRPIVVTGRHQSEHAGVQLQPVQRRNHRRKNAGKEDGDFLDRDEIEVIFPVHVVPGGEIGGETPRWP